MCDRIRQAGFAVLAFAFTLLALSTLSCHSAPAAVSEDVVFYPEPPDPPRVQFLRTVSVGTDIETGRSSLDTLLFGEERLSKSIMAPYGVDVHDGIIYVCDVQQGVVLMLDIEGESFGFLKTKGRGTLRKPNNLCFGPEGRLFVADFGRQQIVVYGKDHEYQDEYGPFSEDSRPVDVAVADGKLFIADPADRCVRVVDLATKEQLLTFGAPGEEESTAAPEDRAVTMRAPTNLVIDGDGNIAVVDTVDCRVFVWSPEGEFQRFVGAAGDTVGSFARPKGIAYRDGLFFVVDAAFENCQILDPGGEPLLFFGGGGVGPGQLYLPTGIYVGEDGLGLFREYLADGFEPEALVAVCSQFGPRKLSFYALGKSDRFEYPDPADSVPSEAGEAEPRMEGSGNGAGRDAEETP